MRPSTLRWRVYVLVGAVLALLLMTVASTSLARLRVGDYNSTLRYTLRPSQASSAALAKAYVDMETGVRGYLLSGQTALLEPYYTGRADAAAARERLGAMLADDPTASRLLRTVDSAAADWEQTLATPAVSGAVTGATTGQAQFDALRQPLADLQSHIDRRTAATLQSSSNASTLATAVTILCAGLALVCGIVILILLQRSLIRPVNHLVENVRRVSAGDLAHKVTADGPAEVITLGHAVESMRERILRESGRAARLEEADRIAQDLGSTTIRDLFSISLALHSTAARHPSAAPALAAVTADVDRVVQEIRGRVFDSQRSVQETVLEVVADLPVAPTLAGATEVPAPPTLEPFLRDVLPLLPPATMTVAATDTTVEVDIRTEAPPDPTEVKERAIHHAATVTNTPEHTVIEWSGPL